MKRALSNLIAGLRMSKPRPTARPGRRARPNLEGLEARWAPSTFQFTLSMGRCCGDDVIVGAGAGGVGGHV